MRPIKKTLFTVNIDDYEPDICEITYPLLQRWAERMGADFHVIKERKFHGWPAAMEKLQIFDLGREMGNDWNIYVDSDALIHPDTPDFTEYIHKDTVMHFGHDLANIRWKYDQYFLRDGRNIGSGNWLAIGSDWCLDLWHPPDFTLEEAISRIRPTVREIASDLVDAEHLVDDFTLSRNIARFGLKFKGIKDLAVEMGREFMLGFFHHEYTVPGEAKVISLRKALDMWGITVP